jgi:hypothetical protein
VQSFDVLDENEDGINEPGEFLLVKSIVFKNNGQIDAFATARPSPYLHPGNTVARAGYDATT